MVDVTRGFGYIDPWGPLAPLSELSRDPLGTFLSPPAPKGAGSSSRGAREGFKEGQLSVKFEPLVV